MRRTLWFALFVSSCAPSEPEAPSYKPANDAERFVFRIVKNMAEGRVDIVEAMMSPALRAQHNAKDLTVLRSELDAALGPLDEPRVLRIDIEPVKRDDGNVGLFGHARAAFARGVVDLRVEIVCTPWERAAEWCKPPYSIDAMTMGPAPKIQNSK